MIHFDCFYRPTHPNAKMPERKHNSAGYDLFACEYTRMMPKQVTKIPLGFATAFPDTYVAVVKDRSGMALKSLEVVAGVIDADYRGEWQVPLYNNGLVEYTVKQGDRIAQVLFIYRFDCAFKRMAELPASVRGSGGFGSTGD